MTFEYPQGQPVEGQRIVDRTTGEETEWRRGQWRPLTNPGWDVPTLVASMTAAVLGMALPALDWALSAAAVAVAFVLLDDRRGKEPRPLASATRGRGDERREQLRLAHRSGHPVAVKP